MDLAPYVDSIHRQLALAADAGGSESRQLAERLFAPLESAIRLTLQEALGAAADEITTELAPGSVELRLRGRDPEFVVSAPLPPASAYEPHPAAAVSSTPEPSEDDEGSMARVNVRMPSQLKARVDQAAARDNISVNSWLVRAATAALDQPDTSGWRRGRGLQGRERYTGWGR
jgi:hypothetical protein